MSIATITILNQITNRIELHNIKIYVDDVLPTLQSIMILLNVMIFMITIFSLNKHITKSSQCQ